MNHYTYRVRYTDGKSYIGVRSCKHDVANDAAYIGSSRHTPNGLYASKEILGVFPSRKEAIMHEVALHEQWDVARSNEFYNRSRQTSTKFDTSGISLERLAEHNAKIKAALTGRKRSEQECLAISFGKKGRVFGPRSQEWRENISLANKGKPNHMKDRQYDSEAHLKAYASRLKYGEVYCWVNRHSGQTEQATCMEMGIKYGRGAKPTQRFRDIVKTDCISKSYLGWELDSGEAVSAAF